MRGIHQENEEEFKKVLKSEQWAKEHLQEELKGVKKDCAVPLLQPE
jgi:hypothetical protein